MPISLDKLLTLRPPATAPLLGTASAPGNTFRVDATDGAPAPPPRTWQLTLGRERGISVPFCAVFMPVPPAEGDGPATTLPPHTVYARWLSEGGDITRRFRVPSSLWHGSEGLLVCLLHLHDRRLIESIDVPLVAGDALRPIADLSSKAIWEAFRQPPATAPEQGEFQAVLTRMLLDELTKARRAPPPNMVRPPDQAALNATEGPGAGSARAQPPASLCFMAASCAYQGGFVDRALQSPTWAAGPADASMQRLIDWRRDASKPQPTLALLLGDQIYADATAGLFDPRSLDNRYVQPYLDAQQSRFLSEALSGIEVHTMIDDHEIDNNCSPISARDLTRHEENQTRFKNGIDAYLTYQCFSRPGNPLNIDDAQRKNEQLLDDYFEKNGIPFLLLDTRTHRERRDALNVDTARLITDTQWASIRWCIRQSSPDKPLFICTPSILLPRRLSTDEQAPASSLLSDAWDGYPVELYTLLAMLHEEQANHVVFLSGDEHLSCIARFTIACEIEVAGKTAVHSRSIHSSPLYAPYPFANGMREQLREYDEFTFTAPHAPAMRYRCRAQTTFAPPGDGFAILQVRMADPTQAPARTSRWSLDVSFSRASGVHPMPA